MLVSMRNVLFFFFVCLSLAKTKHKTNKTKKLSLHSEFFNFVFMFNEIYRDSFNVYTWCQIYYLKSFATREYCV